jgi:molybdate transport system permease protein
MDWSPLFLSLRVAGGATLLSLLTGAPIGYALARRRLRGRAAWEGMLLLPLVLPPSVLGYYLLVLCGRRSPLLALFRRVTGIQLQLVFSYPGIVLAAWTVSMPLLARAVQASFAAIDRDLADAARTQGANEWQVFRHIALPLARQGLIAGVGLAFARALGDFGATLMVAGDIPGETQTMPLAVYDAINAQTPVGDHTALVFVLLLSAVCLLFSLAASWLGARREIT